MPETTKQKLDLRYAKYAQVLEKTRWASEFSWKHICKICQYIEPVRAKRGAIVFKEGANERSLGIIVKGSIKIIKGNNRIGTMKSSQTFGEMALIDGEPRSATGIAEEETLSFSLEKKP